VNGALSEPVGTQWPERAVFRGYQDGKVEEKKNMEGRRVKGDKFIQYKK
jgi:hypothetical protein